MKHIKKTICSAMAVVGLVFTQSLNSNLTTSKKGLEHVAVEEGCRLVAYQCSADRWTAGLGHTSGIDSSTELTEQQVAELFVKDIAEAEEVVKKLISKEPTQAEYDMMVSFVFNLGAGNFKRSTLLKKFNAGDRRGACLQYKRWVYVNGKNCRIDKNNCKGIAKRRDREMDICLNGWS